MSTNDHLLTEDKLFADNWTAVAAAIASTVESERAKGPFAVAERIELSANAGAGPRVSDGPVQTPGAGISKRTRVGLQLTSVSVQDSVTVALTTTAANLIAQVEVLATRLLVAERAHLLASIMAPPRKPWDTTNLLPLDALPKKNGGANANVLVNTQVRGGKNLAECLRKNRDAVAGSVIMGSLGDDRGHLVVPVGALKIYEAGQVRYGRPTAGKFYIETVVAAHLDGALIELEQEPTP